MGSGSSEGSGEALSASPPVSLASVWESKGDPANSAYTYGRYGNPTWTAFEVALGEAESADALLFGSGMAAALALLLSLTSDCSRIVLSSDCYFGVSHLARSFAGRGIVAEIVDLANEETVVAALGRQAAALWIETPSNPLLRTADISRLASLAREASVPTVVDNSLPTAHLQRPLDLGALASITSITKAASGHSDLVLGAAATRDEELLAALRDWRTAAGLIASPMDAWLAHRGFKTAGIRLERQSLGAQTIADYLAAHPRVERVHYPGLGKVASYLATQMPAGYGPLLSFEVAGGADAAEEVVAASRLIRPATSFGGVESSWERRARWASETAPPSLIRLSVGIEPVDAVLEDLESSLASPKAS